MKTLIKRSLLLAGVAAALVSTTSLQAQNQPRGKGNFDPAQFAQQRLDRMREAFDVKDDAEWKLISERITKVTDAQRAIPRGGGGFGRTQGGGGTDPNGDAGAKRQRGGGRTTSTPMPEQDALQKALEAKAPADEIKAKLERLRDARKAAEATYEKAQADLKEVLSTRQEAVAVMFGLLK
jgi:hypothetical protein